MHRILYWRFSGYYFVYFAFIGIFMPYFGLYLQSLSFSAWEISLLMSQMQLMRLFGPYLWGVLADRTGQRVRIIRLTGFISVVVFSSFFFVTSFHALLAALALLTFFWVAALPLVESLTFDHLREKTADYSRVRLWGSIGFIATVTAAGAFLDNFGLAKILWIILLSLVAIGACGLAICEAPAHQSQPDSSSSVGAIVRQPRVIALFAACFFMYAAHGALSIFYSIYLSDHGYSKSAVGGLWSLGVLAEIAVFYFMAVLTRRLSLRRVLLICFGAAVVRFLMIGWGVGMPAVLVVAQLLHGLTFGAFHASTIAAINRSFAGPTRARGQALYSSLTFGAGGLIGGLLAGWTWGQFGSSWTFVLSSSYALLGLVLVMRWIKEEIVPSPELGVADASVSR